VVLLDTIARVDARLLAARLGRCTPMVDWDWAWPTVLDRPTLERVLTLDFVTKRDNLVLVAPQKLGQDRAREESVHQVVLAGYSARFVTASI
jgi:hypothetical protein